LANEEFHNHLTDFVSPEVINSAIDMVKVYQGLEQLKQEMMDIEDEDEDEDEIKMIQERVQDKQTFTR